MKFSAGPKDGSKNKDTNKKPAVTNKTAKSETPKGQEQPQESTPDADAQQYFDAQDVNQELRTDNPKDLPL